MSKTDTLVFRAASRALPIAIGSLLLAACASGGSGTLPDAAVVSQAPMSIVSTGPNDALTVTGTIVGKGSDHFQLEGGSGLGYFNVYTSASTTYSNFTPALGEVVEAAGTGTASTSLHAASVKLLSPVSSAVTASGQVGSLVQGGFTLKTSGTASATSVFPIYSTQYVGTKPYAGEFVTVWGQGSAGSSVVPQKIAQTTLSTSATPAPTAAPTTAPSTSSAVAAYDGCPVFAAGDYYNKDVSAASLNANSADYINSMWGAGNTGTFVEAPEQVVNLATSSTPMVLPKQTTYHVPIYEPWASAFAIEATGDHHSLVLNTSTCKEYEAYDTVYSGGVLSVYSNGVWDLTKPYQMQPVISMASGLSLFAGMIKWNEIQAGHINHALNWTAKYNTASQNGYVAPATSTDHITFNGSGIPMPYGAHLRLRASYSESGLSTQAKVVAEALKHYGMYLSDTAYTNKLFFEKPPAGQSYDVGSLLNNLTIKDFDVVQ